MKLQYRLFLILFLFTPAVFTQPNKVESEEIMPRYPGGEKALRKYFASNIEYPEIAIDSGIQGKVFIQFVIDTDGWVTDVKVLKGLGFGCDEEAVRVVKNMPRWIPGTLDGKKIPVSFHLPVKFLLDEGRIRKKKRHKHQVK